MRSIQPKLLAQHPDLFAILPPLLQTLVHLSLQLGELFQNPALKR